MYYHKIYLPFDGIYPDAGTIPFYYNEEAFINNENEKEQIRDKERLKSMYPEIAKRLQPYVEEECDRLEYEGSFIYDEHPDALSLYQLVRKICKEAMNPGEAEDVLEDICKVLLYNELFFRRSKKREKRKKRFY